MAFEDIRTAADAAENIEIPADMISADDPGATGDDMPAPDHQGPPFDPTGDDTPASRAAMFPLNDFGNGQRMIEYFGEDILFVQRLGWFRWGGDRWVADEDEIEVRRDAQAIAACILREIPFIALEDWQREDLERWHLARADHRTISDILPGDRSEEQQKRFRELGPIREAGETAAEILKKKRSAHQGHARTSGNSNKITNLMAEAKVAASTGVDTLNREKMMVNCRNGVLHFTKEVDAHEAAWGDSAPKWRVELLPQLRAQKISKMMEADYVPDALALVWEAFLERVQPDPEVRLFLQRWFGYALTGLTVEQKLAFFYGIGRNGKSTMVDLIASIFADYGTTLPIETLTGAETRKGSDATPDLVRLPGARLVRASEPEQGTKMKEALIKQLTGGEAIPIRRMHSEFVEIIPEFKMTISGNHKPEIRGADDGIWRRMMLVPFAVQIPDKEVDIMLSVKLEAERDGILAWMVRGCLDYLEHGLPLPKAVRDATAAYREVSDPMREFLLTQCTITDNSADKVPAADLRDAFNAWLIGQALDPWGSRQVSLRLAQSVGVVKNKEGTSILPYKSNGETGQRFLIVNPDAMDRIAGAREQLDRVPGGRRR